MNTSVIQTDCPQAPQVSRAGYQMLSRDALALILFVTCLGSCGTPPLAPVATITPASGTIYQGRTLPPAWRGVPDAPPIWLVGSATAVALRPIALSTSRQQVTPTFPLCLCDIPQLNDAAGQSLILVVGIPIVSLLQVNVRDAAQGSMRSLNEPGHEVTSVQTPTRDLTAFQLSVIEGSREVLLHVKLTYATEPGGPTGDPATGEAHYVVRLAP